MNEVQGRRKEERPLYIVRVVEGSWGIYLVGFSIVSVKEEVVGGNGYIGEKRGMGKIWNKQWRYVREC